MVGGPARRAAPFFEVPWATKSDIEAGDLREQNRKLRQALADCRELLAKTQGMGGKRTLADTLSFDESAPGRAQTGDHVFGLPQKLGQGSSSSVSFKCGFVLIDFVSHQPCLIIDRLKNFKLPGSQFVSETALFVRDECGQNPIGAPPPERNYDNVCELGHVQTLAS
jgi:hypothetical protein